MEFWQCLGYVISGFTAGAGLGYWIGKKRQAVEEVYREYDTRCTVPFGQMPSKGLEVKVVFKKDKAISVVCPYFISSSRKCEFLKDRCLFVR